jgi:hypothetical protein
MRILDAFLKILAIPLCIVLVFLIIATSLSGVVTGLIETETVTKMVNSIDYTQAINNNAELNNQLTEMNVSPEAVEKFVKSDVATDIIDTYIKDVNAFFAGEEADNFTPEAVQRILNNNINEIADIVEEVSTEEFDRDEFKAQFGELVQEQVPDLIKAVPTVETAVPQIFGGSAEAEDIQEILDAVNSVNKGTVIAIMLGITAVFAAIIFAMRLIKLSGFLWIGVATAISAIFMTGITVLFSKVKVILINETPQAAFLINGLDSVMFTRLVTASVILFVAAAALIAVHIVLKKFTKKDA